MKTKFLVAAMAAFSLLGASLQAEGPGGPKPAAMNELIIKCKSSFELLQASEHAIPGIVVRNAKGIAIATVTRGGIGIGGQAGEGIVFAKLEDGWSAPSAFETGGASIGAQLGVETVQYVMVLNTDKALLSFTGDEVALDAKANATAGPDHAAASNDKLPKSDIYVYALTDGAFAGATIGGVYVTLDVELNNEVYSNLVTVNKILAGEAPAPPLMNSLYDQLNQLAEKE